MLKLLTRGFAVVAIAGLAACSHAAFSPLIDGLVNTGTGGADDNWKVTAAPNNASIGDPTVFGPGFPLTAYAPPPNAITPDDSKWIGARANSNDPQSAGNVPQGIYDFTETFTSSAAGLGTFSGIFGSDNALIAVLINDVAVFPAPPSGGFTSPLTLFTVAGNIFNGLNTITFRVNNFSGDTGNPSSLLVAFTDTSVVPEASSVLVWGGSLALVGLVAVRRRRNK